MKASEGQGAPASMIETSKRLQQLLLFRQINGMCFLPLFRGSTQERALMHYFPSMLRLQRVLPHLRHTDVTCVILARKDCIKEILFTLWFCSHVSESEGRLGARCDVRLHTWLTHVLAALPMT